MNNPLLWLGLGVLGYFGYKAMQSSSSSPALTDGSTSTTTTTTTASNGSAVTLPGITVPAGVTLSSTDVAVARALLNTSTRYIKPDGTSPATPPSAPFLDVRTATASDRLAAINYGLQQMSKGTATTLFDAIMTLT